MVVSSCVRPVPPLQPYVLPLVASVPPLGPLAALAARSLPLRLSRRPLRPARSPLQPARRPLQPAHRPLRPARRPLRPARRPLQPANRHLAARSLPLCRPALPACCSAGSAPPCSAHYGFSSCPHWLTCDAAACLAIRNHLLLAECAHFGQHKTAKALQRPIEPIDLTVVLLEQHLLAAETSVVAVGATRGTPRTPFFEGCSPSPIAPSYASAAAVDILGAEDVGAASASGKRPSSKGKGGRVVEVAAGVVVGAAVEVVEVVEVVATIGVVAGVGVLVAAVVAAVGVAVVAAAGVVAVEVELFRGEVLVVASGSSSSVGARPLRPSSFVSGFLSVGHLGAKLLRSRVHIFDLDYDAILAAMYALSVSAEGDCYLCVPPNPGIEAAALGASESALPGTAPAEALHTFTLDSGASRCFFCDSTTLTPLSTHVMRVSICTCTRTGRHLATFNHRPGSSLYTPATEPPQVVASARVYASGPVAPPCLCRLLSHQTLLWHHRLGHPSLPRLHGMHSCLLVFGLPRSLPPLPPSPAPPCLPCVEGRQRAAPHSSSFPPTTAPLQTLHMDVWGPAHVSGQGCERYFLLSISSSASNSARTFLSEFSSDLLRDFCRGEGILQSFMRPASPQQNGIAEHRIGLVMEVARTSMIHAAAPHFLWPFAVQYAAHQLNLWPRLSLPETSPTLRWTGKVGDASVFRVWGSRAFVRDTSADKLSAHAILCVFLSFPPDTPGWQFYHPTSRRALPSQDVTFDESVPFYHLFPYRSAPLPPPPLFLAPGPPPVDPLGPQGRAPSGVSQVDPLPGTVPVNVAVDSGAARGPASGGAEPAGADSGGAEFEGAGSGGAELGGAEPGGAEPGGAEPGGAEPEGAEPRGAEYGGAEPRGTASSRGPADSATGGTRAGGAEATTLGGAGVPAGAGGPGAAGCAGPGGARTRGTRAAGAGGAAGAGAGDTGAGGAGAEGTGASGTGAGAAGGTRAVGPGGARTGGTGAAGADGAAGVGAGGTGAGAAGGTGAAGASGAGDTGAGGAGPRGTGAVGAGSGDTGRPRPYFVPLLQQVLGLPSSTGLTPPLLCPPLDQSQPPLQPPSTLLGPSPYTEQTGGLTERRELASRPASPVCTGRRVPRPRPPPGPGTHAMALRPSSVPLQVPLPPPLESSLPAIFDPESDHARAASPTISRLLATVVTDPSFESTAASALVAELVDFAAAFPLDYATALVTESESASPPSVEGECALGTDVLEDRQEDFECLAAAVPRFASMLLAPEGDPDALDIPTPRSYAEAIMGPYSS
ncbi:unnamed protein product [Closterium sp. NIES-54]